MGIDFVNEEKIVTKFIEELRKVPLIIQLRNADVTIGATRISGSVDIGVHIGDLSEWLKAVA